MDTQILISHLNGEKVLIDCLSSIYKDDKNAKVIVLFNNTQDNSRIQAEKKFPKMKAISTDETVGFAEACNLLVKKSSSKYVVLLNNDTVVENNWLSEMVNTMKRHKNCVAVQPKIKSYYKRDYFEYAGAAGGFIDKYGYPFCRGRIFNSVEKDNGQYDDEKRIFWACGSCMLVDRNFFMSSGGFDESIFMYAEELDLCWRANILGKEVWYSPKSSIYHMGSFTINKEKINFKKEHLITRNHLIIFLKNYSLSKIISLLPGRMILELISAARFPAKKGPSFLMSLFSVPYLFITKTSKLRRKIQSSRKVSDKQLSSLIYPRSIALDHFIGKKSRYSDLYVNI